MGWRLIRSVWVKLESAGEQVRWIHVGVSDYERAALMTKHYSEHILDNGWSLYLPVREKCKLIREVWHLYDQTMAVHQGNVQLKVARAAFHEPAEQKPFGL